MSNTNKPWLERGSIWKTQSSYYSWLRGQIRKSWSKYPVKNAFIKDHRTREQIGFYKNGKPKFAFMGCCNICNNKFKMGELSVDHIIPAGSLKCPEDLEGFVTKLFCSYDNMQLLCKQCHDWKTYADKYCINIEDAKRGVEVAQLNKLKVAPLNKKLKSLGAKEEDLKNKKSRDMFIREHFNITW